jgi:hypothetical protein
MMQEIYIEKLKKSNLLEPFLLFNENPKENFPFYLIQIGPLNRLMDFHLKGHPYVKSPIDMACWDILGKVRKQNF